MSQASPPAIDRDLRVAMVLDQALTGADILNFHPLRNTATTAIALAGLIRFLEAVHRSPMVADQD